MYLLGKRFLLHYTRRPYANMSSEDSGNSIAILSTARTLSRPAPELEHTQFGLPTGDIVRPHPG